MIYELYPYQINILERIKKDVQVEGNSLVVMPTGSGKSHIISSLSWWLDRDVLILCPSREILDQNRKKLEQLVDKDEIGVYSASMNEKTIKTYTFATIGSIYKKPALFKHFKLILIDECHLVNHKKLSTMFMSFLRQIGSPKCIGLTATPYRMETWGERLPNGYVLSHTSTKMINRCMSPFWSRILVSLNIGDLIEAGYLCQPTYIDKTLIPLEDLKANTSHTDYDLNDFQKKIKNKEEEIRAILAWAVKSHKHTLVFCSSVAQAEALKQQFDRSEVISAKTNKKERLRIVDEFRQGRIKMVFNVECLTTGFDFPSLDCIVVLRPSQSIRLHVQMLGRGVRIADGKKTCDIVDLVGNVKKLGKVESVKVERLSDGWNITSDTGHWHSKELYSYSYKANERY